MLRLKACLSHGMSHRLIFFNLLLAIFLLCDEVAGFCQLTGLLQQQQQQQQQIITLPKQSSALRDPCLLHHTIIKSNAPASGHKEPLVLLHGLLGSSRNLQSWGQLLLSHLEGVCDEAILLDIVNHGGSVKHGPLIMDYESMSLDVTYTLQKLGVKSCHLIGHSMGGKIAAAAALMTSSSSSFSPSTSTSSTTNLDIKSLTMLDISPVSYSQQDFATVLTTINFLVQTKSEIAKSVSKRDVSKILAREIHDSSLAAFLLSSIGDVVCPIPPKKKSSNDHADDSSPLLLLLLLLLSLEVVVILLFQIQMQMQI